MIKVKGLAMAIYKRNEIDWVIKLIEVNLGIIKKKKIFQVNKKIY